MWWPMTEHPTGEFWQMSARQHELRTVWALESVLTQEYAVNLWSTCTSSAGPLESEHWNRERRPLHTFARIWTRKKSSSKWTAQSRNNSRLKCFRFRCLGDWRIPLLRLRWDTDSEGRLWERLLRDLPQKNTLSLRTTKMFRKQSLVFYKTTHILSCRMALRCLFGHSTRVHPSGGDNRVEYIPLIFVTASLGWLFPCHWHHHDIFIEGWHSGARLFSSSAVAYVQRQAQSCGFVSTALFVFHLFQDGATAEANFPFVHAE